MGQHMGARRVHPDEEGFAGLLCIVHEGNGGGRYHLVERRHVVFDAWHWARRQRSLIDDLLLAHLAPARLHRLVIRVRGPRVHQVARADRGLPFRRISVIERILHCVQMIKITKILVEAVVGRQELIPVAEVVLAKLAGGITQRLEGRRDGWRLIGHAQCRAGLTDGGQPGADG